MDGWVGMGGWVGVNERGREQPRGKHCVVLVVVVVMVPVCGRLSKGVRVAHRRTKKAWVISLAMEELGRVMACAPFFFFCLHHTPHQTTHHGHNLIHTLSLSPISTA